MLHDFVVAISDNKVAAKEEENKIITDSDTISYVQGKMKEMETEALTHRMKFMEIAMKNMSAEYKKSREEVKILSQMVVSLSTNIEELLNSIEVHQHPTDEDVLAAEEQALEEYEEEELRKGWERSPSKKERLN